MSDKHTPEPWARGTHGADNGEPFDVIFGADGGVVVGDDELTPANARRIVACVNACRGLPTDELEQKGIAAAVGSELLRRDALVAKLSYALAEIEGCFEAAAIDGWADALAEGDMERIKDIYHRRIDYVRGVLSAARGDAC